jgi:hypothetical protein
MEDLVKYCENWSETKKRFGSWWERKDIGRPLLRLVARREKPIESLEEEKSFDDSQEFHMDVEKKLSKARNDFRKLRYMAEAFPALDLNIGPGSLAVYLGSEPVFRWDTVWFSEIANNGIEELGKICYDPENYWWKKHLMSISDAVKLSKGEFLVNIADLIENVDILSALRGTQKFVFDMMDKPSIVKNYIEQLDSIYFEYYDRIYDAVKDSDGGSSYTSFSIWGPGKTAKVQCDFSAMMSPKQFREFVQPSLAWQCSQLDYSLYHLDGPDAIKHLDAVLEIDDLDALQYTPTAGAPDAGNEKWYFIYDKVKEAGKSIWISISDGNIDNWERTAQNLVKRYGSKGSYLLFPVMEESEAERLLIALEKD